jgi:hypothetical protein
MQFPLFDESSLDCSPPASVTVLMQDKPVEMDAHVARQISGLRSMSRAQLLDLWQTVYRKAAPPGIRREILVPFLAYKIQENAYGGLKPSVRAELRRIAQSLKSNPNGLRSRARIKPGSRILRRWGGEMHEVFVTESGYKYRGTSYQNLSQIARRVTGTRWSGPAFFGLKTMKPSRRHDSA